MAQKKKISALTALAFASALALSACGGGGGNGAASGTDNSSSGSGNSGSSSATTGNVATPQYVSGSVQLAMFQAVNAQRQQCGFPALVENTILDQAAQAHAQYMGTNNAVSDSESSSATGFTGATYADRAVHFGYPSATYAGGVSAGYYTATTLSNADYSSAVVNEWLSGVYHIAIAVWPVTAIGVGEYQTSYAGYPEIWASLQIGNLQQSSISAPLTFPCEGSTGLPYKSTGETPTPPNTSGAWGTPVAIAGNPSDVIVLTSGTMTDGSGTVINLQLLDSANDPNGLLPKFEAVAYPASPLTANTSYSVALTGTINGTPFSRTFRFTTGNVVG
ncbi:MULTISPECIES: CAP domain-containing protein [unclassified Paraburkholderia]|uniref:CAP domain-containing protein n=1 Tax=unclassified Paraburkholderia TaxID=2615204 RepID=UPI002AB17FC9|nr:MULTISPECIES: CAP domain-containing protein [unclassified Paraburkholderia]